MQQEASRLSAQSQGGAQEIIYFHQNNIYVTSTRVIVGATTYSMANITSVSVRKKKPSSIVPTVIGVAGLVSIFIGAVLGTVDYELLTWSAICLGSGALMAFLAVAAALMIRPLYFMVLGTASGEHQALGNKDKKFINSIARAINTAIVERG